MAVETAKLVINAPKANVKLNLKSIHDLSHLHCARAEIIVNESFDKCLVYDQLKQQFVKVGDLEATDVPVLKVMAEKELKISIMSDFELIRRKIMEGMANRKTR